VVAQTEGAMKTVVVSLEVLALGEVVSMNRHTSSTMRCKFSIVFIYYSPIFFLDFSIPATIIPQLKSISFWKHGVENLRVDIDGLSKGKKDPVLTMIRQ
jgi:hypothetical protein